MTEFRRIQMSLFLILVLQFTAAANRQLLLSFTVRDGDEVTLSCENVKDDQDHCDGTTWVFSDKRSSAAVELVTLGQIGKNAKSKSDRLSVTANCSLVIKKVTDEDVGRYFCQQYKKSGEKEDPDAVVYLSLLSMTEHKDTDEVTLSCSVLTHGRCTHTVKWLYGGQDVNELNQDRRTSQSPCSASLNSFTFPLIYTSRYNSLKCEVTDGHTKNVQLFPFSLQPSGEDSITTTKPTTTTENRTAGTNKTELRDLWWLFVIVAVVLVALLISVVTVIRWKRTKGNKTGMNDKVRLTSTPEATQSAPETSQDTADPEDGVSYASVSYTKKSNSEAQVRMKEDYDEGDAVTYTTVKAPSADPSNLYTTVR